MQVSLAHIKVLIIIFFLNVFTEKIMYPICGYFINTVSPANSKQGPANVW